MQDVAAVSSRVAGRWRTTSHRSRCDRQRQVPEVPPFPGSGNRPKGRTMPRSFLMTEGQWGHNGVMSRQRCPDWRRRVPPLGPDGGPAKCCCPFLLRLRRWLPGPTPNPSSRATRLVDNELVVVTSILRATGERNPGRPAIGDGPAGARPTRTDLRRISNCGGATRCTQNPGAAAVVTVGGKTPVVTTQAKVRQTLPVALHAGIPAGRCRG